MAPTPASYRQANIGKPNARANVICRLRQISPLCLVSSRLDDSPDLRRTAGSNRPAGPQPPAARRNARL